ncbi:conjugal transfer protein TraF [Atlantibacter hermannii]|uniref:conjugal transfer protein TraF n=1 Tax=Atlantibacter hermannii TaxID=565 RepID=UPI0028A876F2|nr:conjugal transfer protein TraF [Atlantibacter hermannii]
MKKIKLSAVAAAVSLLVANTASAANTWTEARGDAMGGTGVASSHYGSGVLINPALLAKAKPDDDVTVIFPTVGAQISDKGDLRNQIDDVSDRINYYEDVIDNLSPAALADINGTLQQFQNAAGELADQLEELKGKVATARAGGGVAVSIPNDTLSVAFMAKGYAHARVSSSINQGDINYLRDIQNSDLQAAVVAADAIIGGSDRITDRLESTGFGRAAIVADYGVAFAKQFAISDVPVSFGVTPKLQQTWLYNYSVPIYAYDSSDWNSKRYRSEDSGFNVDAGIAADFGENFTVGVSGQNLVSRNIDTKVVNGYSDTYQITPLVTAGVAWNTDMVTLTADGDLTETKGFKSEKDSQYAGVGAEVRPLSWLAVRAGYRADIKGNDNDVFTAGVGFAPFNRVHLDLTGAVGEKETWGAGAQLSVTF